VRALLDANVLISALLSRSGVPARLVELWLDAEFELVVCPALLGEVERTLVRPKFRSRLQPDEVERFLGLLREGAELVPDPEGPPAVRTKDPGDDYLLKLAARENVPIVSGDAHLLALSDEAPVLSPRDFLDALERMQ
jgi:putative PIN family toxin of toxin-antitoxin system